MHLRFFGLLFIALIAEIDCGNTQLRSYLPLEADDYLEKSPLRGENSKQGLKSGENVKPTPVRTPW